MTNHKCPNCNTSTGERDGQNKNYEAYYKCTKCNQGWAETVICPTCFKRYNYEDYCSEPWTHSKIAERFYLTGSATVQTEFRRRIMHSSFQHQERFKNYRDRDYWDRLDASVLKAETEDQD